MVRRQSQRRATAALERSRRHEADVVETLMPRPRNPYYDSDEFKSRWFSSETVESIALDLDVTMEAVRTAALRRGYPIKKVARQ